MNEACAGGTGAFIDQMVSLLDTDAAGLDALAARHTTIYPIASRCGVFAKTDVVPLLQRRRAPRDLAASIFQAVVEQTIGGLACGHPIRGKVAFFGRAPCISCPSSRLALWRPCTWLPKTWWMCRTPSTWWRAVRP